jgi:hypothetical protein
MWRRAAFAIMVLGVFGGAATAFASETGRSRSGSGSAMPPSAVTVNQRTPIAALYPGGAPVTLDGNFDNHHQDSVAIATVSAAVHSFSSQSDLSLPACTQADFAIGGFARVGGSLPTGQGVGSWWGLTVRMIDAARNQDNCKDQTITIDYVATPASR